MDARGSMTMNVTGSTVGPPANLHDLIGQNGVAYASNGNGTPGGMVSGDTIFGNGDAVQSVSTHAIMQGAQKRHHHPTGSVGTAARSGDRFR